MGACYVKKNKTKKNDSETGWNHDAVTFTYELNRTKFV